MLGIGDRVRLLDEIVILKRVCIYFSNEIMHCFKGLFPTEELPNVRVNEFGGQDSLLSPTSCVDLNIPGIE